MARDRVDDVVEQGLRAWLAGDVDAVVALFDDGVTLRWYEPGPWDCAGREQVTELLRLRRSENPDPAAVRVERIDDRTLVASSEESGHNGSVATRITLDGGGRVVAMQQYRTWPEALAGGDSRLGR
jgi:hypothetical protein